MRNQSGHLGEEQALQDRHRRLHRTLSVIGLCALMYIGHLSMDAAAFLEWMYPYMKGVYINPFWDDNYVFPVYEGQPAGVRLTWWINYSVSDFLRVIVMFVLIYVSKSYSYRLYRVCLMFFLYTIISHLMLWYNYRSSGVSFFAMNAAMLIGIIQIFRKEKVTAVVKQMK